MKLTSFSIDNEQQFKIHNDTISFLAKCIKTDGQISPCIVIPLANDKYQIVDGRHRFLAVKEAGLPFVKCIIRNDLATDKVAYKKVQLTTNLARNNDYLPLLSLLTATRNCRNLVIPVSRCQWKPILTKRKFTGI